MTLREHCKGCYRLTLSPDRFGQIIKRGREWHAEIRNTHNGDLVRFAGIWNTRKEAVEELTSIWL